MKAQTASSFIRGLFVVLGLLFILTLAGYEGDQSLRAGRGGDGDVDADRQRIVACRPHRSALYIDWYSYCCHLQASPKGANQSLSGELDLLEPAHLLHCACRFNKPVCVRCL